MDFLYTDHAPNPGGHYSQAVAHGPFLFVSGQLPFSPPGAPVPVGIEEQTEQAIRNIQAILKVGGMTLNDVVKTTVYIESIEMWDAVNAAYARAFGAHRPARSVVPCSTLHHGFSVEIEALAMKSLA